MSHNSRYYRKKIDKNIAQKCNRIDFLFRQKSLSEETVNNEKVDVEIAGTSSDSSLHVAVPKTDDVSENNSYNELNDGPDADSGESDIDHDEPEFKVPVPDSRLFSSQKYELNYPWLYYSVSKTNYICKYCEFFYSNMNYTVSVKESDSPFGTTGVKLGTHPTRKLEKHNKSDNHKKACDAYMGKTKATSVLQMLIKGKEGSQEDKCRNRKYIECLFKTSYFMLRKRWAITDNLNDMMTFLACDLEYNAVAEFRNYNQSNVHYTSPSIVQQILHSISYSLEDEILSSLRNAKWYALLADESADDANREQFAIIARYLRDNSIVEAFLGLINVVRTDAESLMSAIENFLLAKNIPIKNAVFVGFDGCNTMSGVNSGLQRRFRHIVPHQIYINCRNHKLALCVKHLIKFFPVLETLDCLLIEILKLFHYSPQRFHAFENIQETYNMTKLKFIRAAATRWLSHGRASARLLDRYTAILDSLDAIYNRKKEPEVLGVRNMLTDKTTIAAAAILCDILRPVVIFSDYLQGDVHFSKVNIKLKQLTDDLEHLIQRFEGIAEGLDDPDLYLNKLADLWQEIDDRTDLARRLRGGRVFTIQQIVAELGIPMVHRLIFELQDGFQCPPVLNGFSIFELKGVPIAVQELNGFGQVEVGHLANHYGSAKEDVFRGDRTVAQPIFPDHVIINQFSAFKHTLSLIRQRASEEDLNDAHFLLKTFQSDVVLQANYPAMHHLVLLSCLIPSSTACVERLFSLMNTIVIKLRSSLSQESVDNIVRIVSEGPASLSEQQLRKAVNRFREMKDRVLEF